MEFGLDVISKYISTCASCEHNRKGECGFIDIGCREDEPRGLTLGEYEDMTSTELEMMDTRCTGRPCSKQLSHFQLLDAVESRIEELDPEITPEFAKKVISQCYKLVERARRNDGSCGGGLSDTVEAATQIVLSHLDWRALEQGKNINLILRTYEYGYERKNGLFRYCPEKMAVNYLEESKPYDCKGEIPCTEKLIYDPKWQDMVIDQSDIYPEMPTALVNRDRQPIDRRKTQSETDLFGLPYDTSIKPDKAENNQSGTVTAVVTFRKIFTGNDTHDFIDAILAMHDFSFAEPYWEEPEHRSLFIITSMEDSEKFIFHRWGELREEISSCIKAFKYRDEELAEYIKSLLAPAYSTFLHLYPKGNDLEHREARFMLDVFATTSVTSIDYFRDMWRECRAEAKRYVDNFIGGDDKYMEQMADLIHQKQHAFIPYNGCKESWALFNIRSAIFRFIFTIEGCLIENMTEKSIFDYQEKYNTPMVGKITDLDLCLSMDWSVCMVDYYLCEVGHNIETLPSEDYKNILEWATAYSQHDFFEPEQLVVEEVEDDDIDLSLDEIPEDTKGSDAKNEGTISGAGTTVGQTIEIENKELKKYLDALVEGGYCNSDYSFKKVTGVSFLAGWASKIIRFNVPGVTVKQLESIMQVADTSNSASKCQTQNKTTHMRAIERCFTNKELSIDTQ